VQLLAPFRRKRRSEGTSFALEKRRIFRDEAELAETAQATENYHANFIPTIG
jgi:hypothetical protein